MRIARIANRIAKRCTKEAASELLSKRIRELDQQILKTRQDILGLHARKDELSSCVYHQILSQLVSTLKYSMQSRVTVETRFRRIEREPDSDFLWEDWSPA